MNFETTKFLSEWSSYALQKINECMKIQHPYLDIKSVDIIENYCSADLTESDKKYAPEAKFALQNLVVFGDHRNPQLDRSPCGTGTSAKLSLLFAHKELNVGESFIYKSFIGTRFIGRVIGTTKVGNFSGIISQVSGTAYLCGEAKWFMDPDDKMAKGFFIR